MPYTTETMLGKLQIMTWRFEGWIVAQYTCVRSGRFQRGLRALGLIACAEEMYSSYSCEKILQVQVRRYLRARKCMCTIQAA